MPWSCYTYIHYYNINTPATNIITKETEPERVAAAPVDTTRVWLDEELAEVIVKNWEAEELEVPLALVEAVAKLWGTEELEVAIELAEFDAKLWEEVLDIGLELAELEAELWEEEVLEVELELAGLWDVEALVDELEVEGIIVEEPVEDKRVEGDEVVVEVE